MSEYPKHFDWTIPALFQRIVTSAASLYQKVPFSPIPYVAPTQPISFPPPIDSHPTDGLAGISVSGVTGSDVQSVQRKIRVGFLSAFWFRHR